MFYLESDEGPWNISFFGIRVIKVEFRDLTYNPHLLKNQQSPAIPFSLCQKRENNLTVQWSRPGILYLENIDKTCFNSSK